mmetsp:Transcript_8491/g.12826  ORF Transcript_8491/g.12826 Transcript_8491/m.12826 type:complete len:86 (-) Transcript_8491:24-281(-)
MTVESRIEVENLVKLAPNKDLAGKIGERAGDKFRGVPMGVAEEKTDPFESGKRFFLVNLTSSNKSMTASSSFVGLLWLTSREALA